MEIAAGAAVAAAEADVVHDAHQLPEREVRAGHADQLAGGVNGGGAQGEHRDFGAVLVEVGVGDVDAAEAFGGLVPALFGIVIVVVELHGARPGFAVHPRHGVGFLPAFALVGEVETV